MDDRSPWLLFDDPIGLRERVTWRFYRLKSLGGILALQETIGKRWLAELADVPDAAPVEEEAPVTKPEAPAAGEGKVRPRHNRI
jgi:hypothetical protein